jgi:hypothetical protein
VREKIARWHEVERRVPRDYPIIGVEVGVWRGKMSAELLRRLPRLFLIMVDRWCVPPEGDSYLGSGARISGYDQEAYDEAYQRTLAVTLFASDRRRIMRVESGTAAAQLALEEKRFAFVFIDGDHSYLGVKRDVALWRGLVEPGGLLCGHDYSSSPAKRGEVKRAVDEIFPTGVKTGQNSTWFVRL